MSGLVAAFRADWLKLVRRPAIWILAGVLFGILILLGYFIGWYFVRNSPTRNFGQGLTAALLLKAYYPDRFVRNALGGVSGLGSAVSLILGVLAAGSEYGWGTVKTMYTQRPGRLQLLFGRVLVLIVLLAIETAAFLSLAAACSYVIALIDGAPVTWPPPEEILRGFLYALLIWGWYAILGVTLALLFRQSALALGIGLVYVFVVESILFAVLGQVGGDLLKNVQKFFPGPNATALIQSLGAAVELPERLATKPLVGPGQAEVALAVYVVVGLAVSAFLVRTRDEA